MKLNDIEINLQNKFAICFLKVIKDNLGSKNPLYFCGGKFEKRQEILTAFINEHEGKYKINCVSSKDTSSIDNIDTDLLIITNLESIESNPKLQEKVLNIIKDRKEKQKQNQIIIDSNKEIVDLQVNYKLKKCLTNGYIIRVFE